MGKVVDKATKRVLEYNKVVCQKKAVNIFRKKHIKKLMSKGVRQLTYNKEFNDKKIFENLLKETDKEKRNFVEKMKEFLTAQDFYKKTLEEKTDFLLTEKGIKSIIACGRQNLQLVEVANLYGISQRAFIDIKNSHPTIYDAFDLGNSQRDMTVIDAMYKLAGGFYVEEVDEIINESGNPNNPRINHKTIKKQKYIAPNVYAGQYIMNNRKQFEYKRDTDKNQVPESNMFKIELSFEGIDGENE